MYIESVLNRQSPPAVLLRESYRDAGKVKKRTLANLTKWPPPSCKGCEPCSALCASYDWNAPSRRSTAHNATGCWLSSSHASSTPGRNWPTACDSLAETLALGQCDEDDLYAAMDWLLERQDAIERCLAKRHLDDGALVLYDLTGDRIRDEVEPAGLNWISALRRPAIRGWWNRVLEVQHHPDGIRIFEDFQSFTSQGLSVLYEVLGQIYAAHCGSRPENLPGTTEFPTAINNVKNQVNLILRIQLSSQGKGCLILAYLALSGSSSLGIQAGGAE